MEQKFIPKYASWAGGINERLIGIMKGEQTEIDLEPFMRSQLW